MKTLLDMLKEQQTIAQTAEERARVAELKSQLEASEYKVIVNAECIAAGLNPTYEPTALHEERQAIRNEINKLEEIING